MRRNDFYENSLGILVYDVKISEQKISVKLITYISLCLAISAQSQDINIAV